MNYKTNDDIVQCSLAFFRKDQIIESKDLLCTFLGDKSKRRRDHAGNEGRAILAELTDIIDMFRKAEENKMILPTFVCDNVNYIPPSNGFEAVAGAINSLMDEISTLKGEIHNIKSNSIREKIIYDNSINAKNELNELKLLMKDIKQNMVRNNIRRLSNIGSIFDDTHARTQVNSNTLKENNKQNCSIETSSQDDDSPMSPLMPFNDKEAPCESSVFDVVPSAPPLSQESPSTDATYSAMVKSYRPPPSTSRNLARNPFNGRNSNDRPNIQDQSNSKFTKFKSRRNKQTAIFGTKSPSKFQLKSADKSYDLFVGNCNLVITTDVLSEYIKAELNVSLINCEELKASRFTKSFKITVTECDRNTLLTPDSWPEGIKCRKFYSPRK